jgi:hypothetical protein
MRHIRIEQNLHHLNEEGYLLIGLCMNTTFYLTDNPPERGRLIFLKDFSPSPCPTTCCRTWAIPMTPPIPFRTRWVMPAHFPSQARYAEREQEEDGEEDQFEMGDAPDDRFPVQRGHEAFSRSYALQKIPMARKSFRFVL